MATVLSQVHVPPIATSMMASLYGAVRTWDHNITLPDLFGYSGHAFILNIERTLCPSGPTAWDWNAILFPLRQMYSLRRLCASCDKRDTDEARELIWQRTIDSIDAGRPVMLWDAILPEFYLAHGYDAESDAYLVLGPGAERVSGRVPFTRLGLNCGQVWALFPSPHEAPSAATARDLALRGAVAWHRWPNDPTCQWTFGGDAWDVWIAAMRDEEMAHDSSALSYNHYVYAECRRHAADFLEAQGAEFHAPASAYRRVAQALQSICGAWPFPAPIPTLEVRRQLAEVLEEAREAEEEAICALEAVVGRERTAHVPV